MLINILNTIIKILMIILPLLLAVAFLTLIERKILSAIQIRKGPNIVGYYGILQAFADGLKLLLKETILPNRANTIIFLIAPMITFSLSLLGWAVIPFNNNLVLADLNIGILYLLAVSSFGVYGIIISGWASNSKYAFLGSLRSTAQMISYEVSIGLTMISVLLCAGTLNLTKIILAQQSIWYIIPLFPLFIIFFISTLAETNRPPFDLPEAEAESVSGYNVEYSAMTFALFFLGEYANIILMSTLTVCLFFGGWLSPFFFVNNILFFVTKILFFCFLFILVRAAYPRYRYDQLMRLGWKIFLPVSLAWVIFVSGSLISLDYLV